MNRFKMTFGNYGSLPPQTYTMQSLSASVGTSRSTPRAMPTALNAPMIDRVYKAKPGCSACGKKVA